MKDIIKIESISELYEMMYQEKPLHPLVGVIDLTRRGVKDYNEMRVSLGFYSIVFKNICTGAMRYGRNYYDFQEGTLFFTAPNQAIIMEGLEDTEDFYGWALVFHPNLIHGTSLNSKMKEYSFFSYEMFEALHLSNKEEERLNGIVQEIKEELKQNIDKHSKTLIVSSIELLLNYSTRFYDRQFITRTNKNKDVITEFERLLSSYFETEDVQNFGFPSIKYFAEKLHFSPNYLSDLLKKETGKNGSQHIQYCALELAKEMLLSSSKSVSEIAYDLGFEYPQYFSKIFKKNIGITPKQFRTLN